MAARFLSSEFIKALQQRIVAAANPHRNIERHRQFRAVAPGLDRLDGQRRGSLCGKVTGRRAPNDGHVNIAVFHRVDDRRCRVRLTVIAIQHVAAYVLHDAAASKGMRRRRVHRVGAHHLHTDDERAKLRIVERGDMQPAIGACDEDIARAVVWPGAGHHLGAARNTRPDVADVRLQRVTDIAAPLRPPRIVHGRAEIPCNQLHDLVLETPAFPVREREIVGIGADAKRGARPRRRRRSSSPPPMRRR